MKPIILSSIACLILLGAAETHAQGNDSKVENIVGQGDAGPVVAVDGARLVRTKNGLIASVRMPTPLPGTYLYPPGNAFQPMVNVGSPEAFTGWIFIFNNPAECSEGKCDSNDLGPTPARGGAYNFAGHVVGGKNLTLTGHVSVGEAPFGGVPLDNPAGAEVHLAVAPHGMIQPDLLPTQIKAPIGTPAHWWLAFFLP